MNAPVIRRLGLAAALLLSVFAFAQENEKKPEEKKPPASKGKAPSKTPPPQGTPGARPQTPTPPPTQNQPPNAARPNPGGTREGTNNVAPNREGTREGTNNVVPNRAPGNPTPAPANNLNRGLRTGGESVARPVPQGSRVVQTQGGGAVTMRANGRPAVVHASNGVEVHHGLAGRTEVIRESPDHSRVVAFRGGGGYVQRPYVYGGHPYLARTYVVGGRPYQTFYRGYPYHGVYLEVYAPVRYYPVGFYGYVGTPWVRPIGYTWGWVGTPWFRFYGGYFTPYPVYASAPLWLTDYLIAESLNAAYQAQINAQANAQPGAYQPLPPPPGGPVAMTPQVKQAIADEVQRQLAIENAEARANAQNLEPDPAASGIARMLSDNTPHVFVVGDGLDLVNAAGQECAVTEGDVLQVAGPPPPDSPTATMIVMASKGGLECRTGSSVSVALNDLQDMQNHMRRTLDAGLADLQAHQNGLPTPPQAALAMATPAGFTTGAPPPDPTVTSQIDAQFQQGTQLEQQTLAEAGSGPAPAATAQPSAITLGQSTDQVMAILGQPTQVVDLGTKKIYIYPSLKITFNNGQVADVE